MVVSSFNSNTASCTSFPIAASGVRIHGTCCQARCSSNSRVKKSCSDTHQTMAHLLVINSRFELHRVMVRRYALSAGPPLWCSLSLYLTFFARFSTSGLLPTSAGSSTIGTFLIPFADAVKTHDDFVRLINFSRGFSVDSAQVLMFSRFCVQCPTTAAGLRFVQFRFQIRIPHVRLPVLKFDVCMWCAGRSRWSENRLIDIFSSAYRLRASSPTVGASHTRTHPAMEWTAMVK